MKATLTAGLVLLLLTTLAHAGQDLMVFSSSGEVYLKKGNLLIARPMAETLSRSDFVIIKNGTVSLINHESKRVTLSTPGTYDYQTITGMMNKAEASVITRYFVQVWKAMNENPEKNTLTTGGIIRTYDIDNQNSRICLKLFPVDSARIITERFCMVFDNAENEEYTLSISFGDNTILREYTSHDTIFKLHQNMINNGMPGVYSWKLGSAGSNNLHEGTFIIPDADELELLFSRFRVAYEIFSDFEDNMFFQLLAEYFRANRVFVCLY